MSIFAVVWDDHVEARDVALRECGVEAGRVVRSGASHRQDPLAAFLAGWKVEVFGVLPTLVIIWLVARPF